MAVKRYDGSAWQTVAGLGAQGPAATSSSIATWVKTATGGETSVSGNDDNSQPLSYTVGQELVFINGALQKRGADYTATTGNSITGLTALAANDVVTVWTVNAFSVTNAISNTLVDAKGDLIVATGADTPGRLAVGSNNQVLTADSTTGTGLKWATPSSGSLTQLASGSLSGAGVTISSISGAYTHLQLWLYEFSENSAGWFGLRFNGDSGNNYYFAQADSAGLPSTGTADSKIGIQTAGNTAADVKGTNVLDIYFYAQTGRKLVRGNFFGERSGGTLRTGLIGGAWDSTAAITSLTVLPEPTNTFDAGSYILYGVK